MLYYMRRIKTEGLLPEYPGFEVYIDSPLAVEAQIFSIRVWKSALMRKQDAGTVGHQPDPVSGTESGSFQ